MGDPDRSDGVPLSRQISCVRRELAMRARVYPRRIEKGKMTQAAAVHEQLHMLAVLETLESLIHDDAAPF